MDKKERIEKQIYMLKGIRERIDMNRIFTVYGYSFKNIGEVAAGRRQMPKYVLRLITYYVKVQWIWREKE